MKALGKLPLSFQPGTKWQYGLNSDLLGCLIEVISGMNLEDFLRKNIFEPLGMKDTYFNVPSSKASRLATVYTEDPSNNIIPWNHEFRNIDPDYPIMKKHYFSGGAGLSSTAFDYAIFMQMLLNGGKYNGHQILGKRTVEMITSGQLKEGMFGDDNMGLGIWHHFRKICCPGTTKCRFVFVGRVLRYNLLGRSKIKACLFVHDTTESQ
jgi:CubicO group peptidase (beta-lactamase class C family)